MTTDNPFHYAMKSRTLRDQENQNRETRNINILSDRVMQTPEYDQIQNIRKSDLNKTVQQTLNSNRDKSYIAKNLDKVMNSLSPKQLNDFKNKI